MIGETRTMSVSTAARDIREDTANYAFRVTMATRCYRATIANHVIVMVTQPTRAEASATQSVVGATAALDIHIRRVTAVTVVSKDTTEPPSVETAQSASAATMGLSAMSVTECRGSVSVKLGMLDETAGSVRLVMVT